MKKLFTFSLLLLSLQSFGQTFYSDLYGFRLGQYRLAAKNELGKPFQSGKYEDGFEYEAYLLRPDTSLYIGFEYAAGHPDIIWSIQVSGYNATTDLDFRNARLGIDTMQLEKLFGKPSAKETVGEYGQQWNYNKTNFSLEVNKSSKLSSLKILNNSRELFPGPDLSKIPPFQKIQQTLLSADKVAILNLLAGDLEISSNNARYTFKKSFGTEQATDYSKILALLNVLSRDLVTVNTKDPAEYEENMRLTLGEDTKHVIKLKKNHAIREIVFKYYGGRYLICEIMAKTK